MLGLIAGRRQRNPAGVLAVIAGVASDVAGAVGGVVVVTVTSGAEPNGGQGSTTRMGATHAPSRSPSVVVKTVGSDRGGSRPRNAESASNSSSRTGHRHRPRHLDPSEEDDEL